MIPVTITPEPDDFYDRVKSRGEAFLQQNRHPKGREWDKKEFWRNAIPSLARAHNDVCAYCAQWIPKGTGTPTIDHFIPKSLAPHQAYEWTNFRLSCLILNGRKGDFRDVIDPFTLQPGWFELDFASFMLKPNPELSDLEKKQVYDTLKRFKLNEDEAFITSRQEWYQEYINGYYPFSHLQKRAPFIAAELQRQGMLNA